MSVSISNLRSRCLVFVLPHEGVCTSLGRCLCTPPERRAGRPVAASLTLATGMSASGLPEAFLKAPDVARAIQRSEVRVAEVAPPRATETPRAPTESSKRGSE
jgi:hypothetical protein